MSQTEYTLDVPPIVQTQLTGFRLGAQYVRGKHAWRCEFWAQDGNIVRLFHNGTAVEEAEGVPLYVWQFVRKVRRNFLSN